MVGYRNCGTALLTQRMLCEKRVIDMKIYPFATRSARLRSDSIEEALAQADEAGATTTSSSSMNSSACSSVRRIGGELDVLVRAGGAYVGELLLLERIDNETTRRGVAEKPMQTVVRWGILEKIRIARP